MKKENIITKDLKYYTSLEYPMVVKKDIEEKVYIIEFPDLPGCIAHGKTVSGAVKLAQNVKESWIELALSLGRDIPEPKAEEEYSGRFSLRLPKDLHKRLSDQATTENRSLNQHCIILLSERSRALDIDSSISRFDKMLNRLELDLERQKTMFFLNAKSSTGALGIYKEVLQKGSSTAGMTVNNIIVDTKQ